MRINTAFFALFLSCFLRVSTTNIEVLSVLPSPNPGQTSVELQTSDSITVIYNSAVIPLGSDWETIPQQYIPFYLGVDVPGNIRWVTTSIARFDPDDNWPSDLEFEITINPVVGPNGAVVNTSFPPTTFWTSSNAMFISDVYSATADTLTNNTWVPTIGESYEVPPDGEIVLSFISSVDIMMIADVLQVTGPLGEISFQAKNCTWPSDLCLVIVPEVSSQPDIDYNITVPAGSMISKYGGLTKENMILSFSSLYAFGFQFSVPPNTNSQTLALYLEHGLSQGTAALTVLKELITITPPLPFTLDIPYSWMITINANFMPNEIYNITILPSDSVKDGFGLPLQGSSVSLEMDPAVSFVIQPEASCANFEDFPNNLNWTILSRNPTQTTCPPAYIVATNINSDNIEAAIATSNNPYNSFMKGTSHFVPQVTNGNVDVTSFPPPFGTTNLWLNEEWFSCDSVSFQMTKTKSYLISMNKFSVTVLSGSHSILVWVTQTDANTNVVGAEVNIYGYTSDSYPITPDIVKMLLGPYTTNTDGLVRIDASSLPPLTYSALAVVSVNGLMQVSDSFTISGLGNYITTQLMATLITDRTIYSPGDTIYVKGYLRNRAATQQSYSIPNYPFATLNIQWYQTDKPTSYSLELSPSATFNISIQVPTDTTFSTKQLLLFVPNSMYQVAYQEVIVGNPRIPTTTISLVSSDVVYKPQQPVSLTLSLKTYVGTVIPNAIVTVSWTLKHQPSPFRISDFFYGIDALLPNPTTAIPDDYGTRSVVTGSDEFVNFDLSLTMLQNPAKIGDTLIITANYFSPTKESIEDTISLPVAYSSLSISIKPTIIGTIIPDQPFGVYAVTQDLSENGVTISGVSVTVQLYEWDGVTLPVINELTGIPDITGETVGPSCTFLSIDGTNPGCTSPGFQLPSMGQFLLVGTAQDQTSYTVVAVVPVGQNSTQWLSNPLSKSSDIEFVLDKESYNLPDTVSISFYNPYPSAMILTRWGNYPSDKTAVHTETKGTTKIQFEIGEECFGGCYVNIVLTAPRLPDGTSVEVPTSLLYDPNGPTTISEELLINVVVPVKNLDVSVMPSNMVVGPRETATLSINVTKSGNPAACELAIFVVNKAILDLAPQSITNFNETLASYTLYESYDLYDSRKYIALSSAYSKALQILQKRFSDDPFITDNWPLLPNTNNIDSLDVPDDVFLSYYKTPITYFPVSFPYPPWDPPVFITKIFTLVTSSTTSSPESPEFIRSNFVTTPLFVGRLVVDDTGMVDVPFVMPDNLGTFDVRVYAIDDDSAFGAGETQIISVVPFSLEVAAPSIVRTGDQFLSGVTVTIEDTQFSGPVDVKVNWVCELLTVNGPTQKRVQMTGPGPHLVNFEFIANGVGSAGLLYRVALPTTQNGETVEQLVDAALYIQDIVGQQEPVFMATSEALPASTSVQLSIPESVPYSGNLSINIGVGRLPAIKWFTDYVVTAVADPNPTSDVILGSLIPYITFSIYNISCCPSVLSQFRSSLELLQLYTDPNEGLQIIIPSSGINVFTNVRLQAFGIFVLSEALQTPLSEEDRNITVTLMNVWQQATLTQLTNEAEAARQNGNTYNNFDTLAFVYLALGTNQELSLNTETQVTQDLSLSQLLSSLDSLSSSGKGALALALLRDGVQMETATELIVDLTNTLRTQGRTAYITEAGSAQPNFLASALGLEIYVLQQSTNPLIEKLANFIAQEDSQTTQYVSFSGEQVSHFMLGLARYDVLMHNNLPNIDVSVTSGSQLLLSGHFTSPAQIPVETTLYFEEITNSELNATACCVGEASAVFGLSFVPLTINTEPVYRGITVNRIIQLFDSTTNSAIGGPIFQASLGQMVVTTIEITISDYSPSIVIIDPFPAALEPLDDSIYQVPSGNIPCCGWNYWWFYLWSAFSQKEFRSDKVIIYGQNLFAGTHTTTYYSMVNTEGSFVLPPTYAYDAFQPELMGLSAGGVFNTTGFSPEPLSEPDVSSCLPWENRTLSISELQSLLQSFSNPETSILEGNNENEVLAIALGVGIVLGLLLLVAGVIVGYWIFYKKEDKLSRL